MLVKPYGDTRDDGAIQLSFTLPLPAGPLAKGAAKALAAKLGLTAVQVTAMEALGPDFTFFVLYGRTALGVETEELVLEHTSTQTWSKAEIEELVQKNWQRPLVVLGACIESDAHTVGIDAIMNMKGYNGHKGLESYHCFRAINLGAQVPSELVVARVREEKADALLVSQVVTQKDIHIQQLTRLVDLLEAEGLRHDLILVAGGPRIEPALARQLGYDAGFGPGTYAEDAAAFIVQEKLRREGKWK